MVVATTGFAGKTFFFWCGTAAARQGGQAASFVKQKREGENTEKKLTEGGHTEKLPS